MRKTTEHALAAAIVLTGAFSLAASSHPTPLRLEPAVTSLSVETDNAAPRSHDDAALTAAHFCHRAMHIGERFRLPR